MRTKFVSAIVLTAAIALATAFTLSCSGGDDGPADNPGNPSGSSSSSVGSPSGGGPIKKAKISGVFQKGPFIAGTQATLNELNDDLSPTGRPYQTLLTDDKGTFELRNVELVSPYAHLIANGFYRNEVTGNKSAAPITLQAIVDVTDKDNVNVNILTHLEYYRVLDLVDGGMTVKTAKKQAQKEIFAVFGIDSDSFKDSEDMTIFGASESDAALLAVSILLLGDLSEAEFSERLMSLSMAIKNGEAWGNNVEVTDYCKYNGPNNCWPMPTEDMCRNGTLVKTCSNPDMILGEKGRIAKWAVDAGLNGMLKKARGNILGWGLSSAVPNFEKFVSGYWVANLCSENNCFTDPRDGNTYRLATISNKTVMIDWMRYRGEDGNLGGNKTLNYYGVGYRIEFAAYTKNELENICPAGWRLPNSADAEPFINYLNSGIFSEPHYLDHWFNGQVGSFSEEGIWHCASCDYVTGADRSDEPTMGIAPVYCVKN